MVQVSCFMLFNFAKCNRITAVNNFNWPFKFNPSKLTNFMRFKSDLQNVVSTMATIKGSGNIMVVTQAMND